MMRRWTASGNNEKVDGKRQQLRRRKMRKRLECKAAARRKMTMWGDEE